MQDKKNSGDSIDADHVRRLTQIGRGAFCGEGYRPSLEKILTEARTITNADGGTLYMMSDNEKELQFAFVQNESLGLDMGGTGDEMTWPTLKLIAADGSSDHAHVSAHVAMTGEAVNIPDVYDAPGFNFEGPRAFDQATGYRSQSMLVVPMRNHDNDIIGVLQLINCERSGGGSGHPFFREGAGTGRVSGLSGSGGSDQQPADC